MKILQVTAVDFTLKKFLLPLIDAQINRGDEIHIACYCGKYSEELTNEGYIIHHVPFDRNLNVVSHMKNVWKLVRLLKKEKYDCIHTHTPVASIIARLAAKIAGTPSIVYTAHGFYFHENMNPIVYKIAFLIEKYWARWFSDYIFFQSIEDYELANTSRFLESTRLLHIGNGVSADTFNPNSYDRNLIREQLGFQDNEKVIMFVGRLVKEKGLSELLQAYRLVREQVNDCILVIVGDSVKGDRDSFDIRSIINSFPGEIRSNVHLLGLRNDIPQLLLAADLFVLPSYREGLPRSIIEAMAMNKPIIATDIRGCREEVIDGYNGYLCKVRNIEDLADKLISILGDQNKMEQFGINSRQLFLNEFDEEKVIAKQLHVFDKIREDFNVQARKEIN